MKAIFLVPFFLAAALAGPAPSGGGADCDPAKCKASANCVCASTEPPDKMDVKDMPQLVMLNFNGAVNEVNMPFYREFLETSKRKNKQSGCKIGATFFVNHEYLDYTSVHELHNMGHEIALRSITLNGTFEYWKNLDASGWKAEIVGERDLLAKVAEIPASDIVGMRAPLLTTGGDRSYKTIKEAGLLYDTSIPHKRVRGQGRPVFPYTMDYGLQTACVIEPCPNNTYPGLWTVPLNVWFKMNKIEHLDIEFPCSTLDSCTPPPTTEKETYDFLMSNFMDSYGDNKAPFQISMHEGWLREGERKQGFIKFIDELLSKDDVFLVTFKEVIEFMKNPKPAKSYKESRCLTEVKKSTKCTKPVSCVFKGLQIGNNGGERSMRSCIPCPKEYPWVNSPKQ